MKKKILLIVCIVMLISCLCVAPAFADKRTEVTNWRVIQQGTSYFRFVYAAQNFLANDTYDESTLLGDVDGSFGSGTKAAVKKFQENQNFSVASRDGIVGPQTWGAMYDNLLGPITSGGYYYFNNNQDPCDQVSVWRRSTTSNSWQTGNQSGTWVSIVS